MNPPDPDFPKASEGGDEHNERLISRQVRNVELPERQRQVVALIARGFSAAEIAAKLNVSANTVTNHRRAALLRLGLRGTAGLVHYALMRKLIELGEVDGAGEE